MKFKHLILLLAFACTIVIMPKANAQVTKYQYLNSSFGVISEFNGGQPNATGVRYIRIFFDDSYTVNHSYTFSNTFSITTIGEESQFNFTANTAGINFGGAYVVSQPSSLQRLNSWQQSVSYYKQVASSFNYKATGTTSYTFLQYNLGKDMHVVGFAQESYSIQDKGDDTSQTIINSANNIVNNNNATTQIITNNDNKNTQEIINSQNETTSAINDVNDTLQDTEIEGESIGGKLADIGEISDTPITDLITLPVTLLQSIYNSINGSCSAYSLPFGFGLTNYTLNLPCIDLGHEKYLGRVVWGVVDDLFCIFMLFFLFKMIVWFYTNWSTLKDNFGYLVDPSNRGLF